MLALDFHVDPVAQTAIATRPNLKVQKKQGM